MKRYRYFIPFSDCLVFLNSQKGPPRHRPCSHCGQIWLSSTGGGIQGGHHCLSHHCSSKENLVAPLNFRENDRNNSLLLKTVTNCLLAPLKFFSSRNPANCNPASEKSGKSRRFCFWVREVKQPLTQSKMNCCLLSFSHILFKTKCHSFFNFLDQSPTLGK